MRNIALLSILLISGCKAIVSTSSVDYKYEGHAYVRSTIDKDLAQEAAVNTCRTGSGSDGYLTRARFVKDDGSSLVFSCYITTHEKIAEENRLAEIERVEEKERVYKEFYMAKERQYEQFKKDGKVHTDVYTEPDGAIRATTIKGESRCDTYADSSHASSTCN